MKILDGIGTGKEAKVDSDNRLATISTTQTEEHYNSLREGQTFMFSTGGFIALSTTATETGILYIKNTSTTKNLVISSIRTCGEVSQKVIFYKNPTGGTLISNATAGQSTNLNIASANTADATVYKGADAVTVSGGTHIGQHINGSSGHSTVDTKDALILGRNDSIAVTMEVGSAADVCIAIQGYFSSL